MQEFFESYTFIVSFLILVLFFSLTLGEKFAQYFLMLTAASMIVVNYKKFETIFKGIGG